jgi:hypothetical protein
VAHRPLSGRSARRRRPRQHRLAARPGRQPRTARRPRHRRRRPDPPPVPPTRPPSTSGSGSPPLIQPTPKGSVTSPRPKSESLALSTRDDSVTCSWYTNVRSEAADIGTRAGRGTANGPSRQFPDWRRVRHPERGQVTAGNSQAADLPRQRAPSRPGGAPAVCQRLLCRTHLRLGYSAARLLAGHGSRGAKQ